MPTTSQTIKSLSRQLFKKPKKRRSKRVRGHSNQSILSNSPARPLGQKFFFKCRYYDDIVLDPTTGGVPATHIFRLNSLYDPDYTGIGHQPLGFDQIMPLYNHYTVLGAKVTLIWSNHDPSYNKMCIAQIKDNTTLSTISGEMIENAMCKYAVIAPKQAGPSINKMVFTISMSKFFGRPILGEHDFTADIVTNPVEKVYLHLTSNPFDAVDATDTHVSVLIEYVALLTEPKQLGQS